MNYAGTDVTGPILIYHAATVAQLFAMLGYMFRKQAFLGVSRVCLRD